MSHLRPKCFSTYVCRKPVNILLYGGILLTTASYAAPKLSEKKNNARIVLKNSDILDGRITSSGPRTIQLKATRAEIQHVNLTHRFRPETKLTSAVQYHILHLNDGTTLKGFINILPSGDAKIFRNDYLPDGFEIKKRDIKAIISPEKISIRTNSGISFVGYVTQQKSHSIVLENISQDARHIEIATAEIAEIKYGVTNEKGDILPGVTGDALWTWNKGRIAFGGGVKTSLGRYHDVIPWGYGVLLSYDLGLDIFWKRIFPRVNSPNRRSGILPGLRLETDYGRYLKNEADLQYFAFTFGPIWLIAPPWLKGNFITALLAGSAFEKIRKNQETAEEFSLRLVAVLGYEFPVSNFKLFVHWRAAMNNDSDLPLFSVEATAGLVYQFGKSG